MNKIGQLLTLSMKRDNRHWVVCTTAEVEQHAMVLVRTATMHCQKLPFHLHVSVLCAQTKRELPTFLLF
jgi:hypothetical protein